MRAPGGDACGEDDEDDERDVAAGGLDENGGAEAERSVGAEPEQEIAFAPCCFVRPDCPFRAQQAAHSTSRRRPPRYCAWGCVSIAGSVCAAYTAGSGGGVCVAGGVGGGGVVCAGVVVSPAGGCPEGAGIGPTGSPIAPR